ncbi:MAG: DNA-3-methyladenine glycosylase family protein [Gammaproteobacteria bacterium]
MAAPNGAPRVLTRAAIDAGARELARRDRQLAAILARHGPPPMWSRRPGFASLVHIVLEQQVSIAAAKTLFRRVGARIGGMTPGNVLATGVAGLHRLGLTRQKASYCHGLACAIRDCGLDLGAIARAPDDEGRAALLALRGIGPWSVDVYYLMALRRPDVWPRGDLALATALAEVKRLRRRPGHEEQQKISAGWAPWRSVAARLLWQHYLGR